MKIEHLIGVVTSLAFWILFGLYVWLKKENRIMLFLERKPKRKRFGVNMYYLALFGSFAGVIFVIFNIQ